MTGEPVGAGIASQAVDGLLDGSDTAGPPSAAVGFLSAPLDDAIGDQDADTVGDETAASNGTASNGAGVNGTSVETSAVVNGSIAVDGASLVNGAVYIGTVAPADAGAALDDTLLGETALGETSLDETVLDDTEVAEGVEIAPVGVEIAGEDAAGLASDFADGDVDDEAVAAPEIDVGNLSAAGEPSDVGRRRTDVTETLAAPALLPEVVLAPEAFTAQARAASAAWDAAEVVTEIYTGHYNQLVRLAVLLVHDVQTAEEVVQDAFEAMHLAWRRLRDSEKALSYLRQTVVNRSRSVLRHRKVVDMHAPKPAPDEPSAEHAALTLLERSAVAAALRSLPLRQREAIVLRYYADFSEADIAAAMGISRGAVKSHTARAMAALKSILEQETS